MPVVPVRLLIVLCTDEMTAENYAFMREVKKNITNIEIIPIWVADKEKNYKQICKENTVIVRTMNHNSYEKFNFEYRSYSEKFDVFRRYFAGQYSGYETTCVYNIEKYNAKVFMTISEDRENNKTQVLMQVNTDQLDSRTVFELNDYIKKEMRKQIKGSRLPIEKPYVTCVVCVDERTEIFDSIFCSEITEEIWCLPVGIVDDKIYIPK